jgi:hypothetical protein
LILDAPREFTAVEWAHLLHDLGQYGLVVHLAVAAAAVCGGVAASLAGARGRVGDHARPDAAAGYDPRAGHGRAHVDDFIAVSPP